MKKLLMLSFFASFCAHVYGQKIEMQTGISYLNVQPLNEALAVRDIFPVSNSFMTFGIGANLRDKSNYSIDFVYRVSANLNNAAFEASNSNGSKDALFNIQSAGVEVIMFRQTFGKFKIEPILGLSYLWASINISDVELDTTSFPAILNNSQTTRDLVLSRRMTAGTLGGRFSYGFRIKEKPLLIGLYPLIAADFMGGYDSGWMSGRQRVYGLEKLNLRHLSVLGTISIAL